MNLLQIKFKYISAYVNSADYIIMRVGRVAQSVYATGYGLDGQGIEFRWGRDFSHTFRLAVGPTQPPLQWVPGLSRG
jgi:hypothetical protein